VQKKPPSELPLSIKHLHGQFTLWDIAWQSEKSIVELAQGLAPHIEAGIINLQKIPDSQLPNAKRSSTLTPASSAQPLKRATPSVSTQTTSSQLKRLPLIACIDDSPVLAHTLSKILVPAGYQVLSIQEPMRGFTQLIEHKPDLILLDLLLPNADGYSVCKFLRETPVFENTPIIILTARNTDIDRIRARLAGATEFLGKPPIAEELLPLLERFLAPKIKS
jgi:chemotaxis family two-component system response regulator PixG